MSNTHLGNVNIAPVLNSSPLMNHTHVAWSGTIDYDKNTTVFNGGATWYASERIEGSAANLRPALDSRWTSYAAALVDIESSTLASTGDLIYRMGANVAALGVGGEGRLLERTSSGVLRWTRPSTGDGRSATSAVDRN